MQNSNDIIKEIQDQDERYASGHFSSYFKYCSDNSSVIRNIFQEQQIRFTQPSALNDPLEFNPIMQFNDNQGKYQYYNLNGLIFPSVENIFRKVVIESQSKGYGILSLTKIPNSFNMWSRYANGHRGFIIEFKKDFWKYTCMKSKTGQPYEVRKVEYIDNYSINLDLLANGTGEILVKDIHDLLFYRKTSRWRNEHEHRMVRPLTDCPDYRPKKNTRTNNDKKVYCFPFNVNSIESIILGAAMTVKNKKMIARYCNDHNIRYSMALIIRDHKDSSGIPSTVLIYFYDTFKDINEILQAQPQYLVTDTTKLSYTIDKKELRINKLSDLPYYIDYKEATLKLAKHIAKYHKRKKEEGKL